MNHNLKYYLLYSLLYGVILLLGEGMYRYIGFEKARTRNFSHLAAGLISLPFPWLFTSHWWVLLLAVQSSAVLFVTRSAGWFPSHHSSAGNSLGSPLFFASLYLCYLTSSIWGDVTYFLLPILILTISDVAASLIGSTFGTVPLRPWNRWWSSGKTLLGSAAFFITSWFIAFMVYRILQNEDLGSAIGKGWGIAVAATLGEAVFSRGFDNFFIPFISLIFIWLFSFL